MAMFAQQGQYSAQNLLNSNHITWIGGMKGALTYHGTTVKLKFIRIETGVKQNPRIH